jgi:GntR family transcriptional regulator / MocR family aminotransferase
VALAEKYQVPILEDDFVGDLRYKGVAQLALKALDHSRNLLYVRTFSPMLIPSLRVGYLAVSGPVFQ